MVVCSALHFTLTPQDNIYWHGGDQTKAPLQSQNLRTVAARLRNEYPQLVFEDIRVVENTDVSAEQAELFIGEAFQECGCPNLAPVIAKHGKIERCYKLLMLELVGVTALPPSAVLRDIFAMPDVLCTRASGEHALRAAALHWHCPNRYRPECDYMIEMIYVAPKLRRLNIAASLFRALPTPRINGIHAGSEQFWARMQECYKDYW